MSPAVFVAISSLSVVLLICLYIIMRLANEVLFLHEDVQQACDVEHAKCMAAVMAYVGEEFAAQVLRVAADDYESVEEIERLKRLGLERYQPGGSPMPSIWMRDRADRLVSANE